MITAKEAKALYDESGAEAKALLKTFEPKIIEAAKSGKNGRSFSLIHIQHTKRPIQR